MMNEESEMFIPTLWKEYNKSRFLLEEELGCTSNVVDEYAKYLIKEYLNGELLDSSHESADVERDGVLYRVKSTTLDYSAGTTASLSVFRAWDFDYLAVVIFNEYGDVKRASIVSSSVAKMLAVENQYQSGYVITTTGNFFNCRKHKDITREIKELNGEEVDDDCQVLPIKSRTFVKLDRISLWATQPNHCGHRLVKAYLKLSESQDVTKGDFRKICSNSYIEPDLYVDKFTQHFNSMTTDAGNSHGKVFFEDNGFVYVYPQAMSEIENYFYKT